VSYIVVFSTTYGSLNHFEQDIEYMHSANKVGRRGNSVVGVTVRRHWPPIAKTLLLNTVSEMPPSRGHDYITNTDERYQRP
jgi:hypothetical protein